MGCSSKIRMVLGADEKIPSSLEEARLARLGGEQIEVFKEEKIEVDENTGFTSWSKVTVRKSTMNNEASKAKERAEARKIEDLQKAEDMKKEVETKKMEEAKHENADDSALGAYDVWNRSKGGYKGVDISREMKLDASDTAKSLAKGASVSF